MYNFKFVPCFVFFLYSSSSRCFQERGHLVNGRSSLPEHELAHRHYRAMPWLEPDTWPGESSRPCRSGSGLGFLICPQEGLAQPQIILFYFQKHVFLTTSGLLSFVLSFYLIKKNNALSFEPNVRLSRAKQHRWEWGGCCTLLVYRMIFWCIGNVASLRGGSSQVHDLMSHQFLLGIRSQPPFLWADAACARTLPSE